MAAARRIAFVALAAALAAGTARAQGFGKLLPEGYEPPSGDGTEVADYNAYVEELAKAPVKSVIDTNTVVRLGYELPARTIIGGKGGERKIYAKGLLAQCAIGEPKRFEMYDGGALALGAAGFHFDSNYAKGVTNEVIFAGGAIAAFEPSYIRSAAPIELLGDVRVVTKYNLIFRSSFTGPGNIVKRGKATLAMQYPCADAKGTLTVEDGTLAFGPAGSWGGTVVLKAGATLKCTTVSAIGKLVREKGSKVEETGGTRGDFSEGAFPQPATAYNFKKLQKEKLGRGVYAWRLSEDEVRVSWRYKSTDPKDVGFNVYRDGVKLNSSPITDVTYFTDKFPWTGKKAIVYEVRGVTAKGKEVPFKVSSTWVVPSVAKVGYTDILLKPPKPSKTPEGKPYEYQPYDCSVGDLDGDGELELMIIWWPTIAMDNSGWGQTGETWLEGVKLDGTHKSLWKINLGPNIRSGSHYVPVMVADFDGDGAAELICRTADGTMDGSGRILNDGAWSKGNSFKDWRVEDGHVVFAPNYVTCFSGKTGEALDTVPYKPAVHEDPKVIAKKDSRAVKKFWSARNPGNQAFRFLAAVGFLDGQHPSAIMCRGYYSRTCIAAFDFLDGKLKERWYFTSDDEEHWGYGGQGFHNLRIGDIDFDGKDELVYGHMCVDHDGKGLWTTGYGHGDALHLIQASPETRGLQVWTCHEASPYGVSLLDAQTGRTIFRRTGPSDTGSCNALDVDPNAPGIELFGATHCGIFSAKTLQQYHNPKPKPTSNYYDNLRFGIWWKGDLTRSTYSGGDRIHEYSVKGRTSKTVWQGDESCTSNHSTKGCPCLIADILGDWREELLLRRKDNKAIRIYMTPEETPYRFHTFLEDPVYRESVATENCGYNVPTDPGFYFGPDLLGHGITFRGTDLK